MTVQTFFYHLLGAERTRRRIFDANLEWVAGRDQTQRFDLPSAKSFATAVCRTCGSPVPRLSRDGQRAVIRYRAARSEAVQQPHATKLYRQIVEEYPDSPYANQAKTRLAELEKAR